MDRIMGQMIEKELKNQYENAARSAEEADAVRRHNEQLRQQHQQQSQQNHQQQRAADVAAGQAARTQSWYTKPIGIYDRIEPIDPRKRGSVRWLNNIVVK